MLESIILSLTTLFKVRNILAMILGTAGGIAIGVLPGFTAAMGVALLVPITFAMSAETGLVMLAGIYNGAIYGGSISATLLRVPGTPASIATLYDGYPMAQKGRADEALELGLSASVFGGVFSAIVLLFMAPPLAELSLKFGAAEFFWLAILGLSLVVTLSEGSLVKGFMSACLGLLIGVVGMDPTFARPRFTFGIPDLMGGFDVVSLLIGIYSIPQVLNFAESCLDAGVMEAAGQAVERIKCRPFQSFKEFWRTYVRSSVIGTVVGIIPAAGGNIASIVGYNEAKRASKHPELFGTGYGEGIVASEAANNAMTGGSLVPLLALGVPGSAVAAIMLGAFMIHGLNVGPELFTKNADVVYTFMLGMLFTNIIMLFLGFYGARKVFVHVTRVPKSILGPVIAILCVTGSFAIRNSMFDVFVMLGFGFVGYIMEKCDYPMAPVALALILGPMAEANLRRALIIQSNPFSALLGSPLSVILCAICVLSVGSSIMQQHRRARRAQVGPGIGLGKG